MAANPPDGHDFFAPTPSVTGGPPPVRPGAGLTGPIRAGTPSHLLPQTSRWAKSDTTFGPVGRVVTTIALFVPLVFFVGSGVLTQDPFVLVGAVIWAGLMVPGLRHVWATTRRH